MKRLKILLTNDDGIYAPGIKVLWKALHQSNIADLFIIAPSTEKSGTGASITWEKPILIQKVEWPENTPAWAVGGSPADCIKMGERVILNHRPDFIVSGINAGSNAGRNVLHSGTVGACIEGAFRGIPGIAFSCENGQTPNFHVAEKYVTSLLQYAIDNPLPPGCFFNVNFPHAAQDEVKGFRMTRQGVGRWIEDPILHLQTEHGPSYWLGGKPEEVPEGNESDIAWLKKGYLTVVPIQVHDLTDHSVLALRQRAFTEQFELSKKS
jgi:5'-nucleotidase